MRSQRSALPSYRLQPPRAAASTTQPQTDARRPCLCIQARPLARCKPQRQAQHSHQRQPAAARTVDPPSPSMHLHNVHVRARCDRLTQRQFWAVQRLPCANTRPSAPSNARPAAQSHMRNTRAVAAAACMATCLRARSVPTSLQTCSARAALPCASHPSLQSLVPTLGRPGECSKLPRLIFFVLLLL